MLVTASLVVGLVVGAIAAVLVLRGWSGSSVATAARRREALLAETDQQVEAPFAGGATSGPPEGGTASGG